jgi:hypothetical protein
MPEVTLPVGEVLTTTPRPPRNLETSLPNVAAGARLIQAEGLDSESAVDVAASLADALEELQRLQRRLGRRIRRDRGRRESTSS